MNREIPVLIWWWFIRTVTTLFLILVWGIFTLDYLIEGITLLIIAIAVLFANAGIFAESKGEEGSTFLTTVFIVVFWGAISLAPLGVVISERLTLYYHTADEQWVDTVEVKVLVMVARKFGIFDEKALIPGVPRPLLDKSLSKLSSYQAPIPEEVLACSTTNCVQEKLNQLPQRDFRNRRLP